MPKLKKFNFKCSNCKHPYIDETCDLGLESECPNCGTYNYQESEKLKKINKEKISQAKKKIIMEIL